MRATPRCCGCSSGSRRQYDFTVVDMTSVYSFGGDPAGFFDATHMTRRTSAG